MIKMHAVAVFFAAVLSGCTICTDCELQNARQGPIKKNYTYYYPESQSAAENTWVTPATSYYSPPRYSPSANQFTVPRIVPPIDNYSSAPRLNYPVMNPFTGPSGWNQPLLWKYSALSYPSAEWSAKFIDQQPGTTYHPIINPRPFDWRDGMLRRYWPPVPRDSSPIYLGPVWYSP